MENEFEVVWTGRMELLPSRESRPNGNWAGNPVKRRYKDRTSKKVIEANERRLAEGRFCLCEGETVCDFHKRGDYTTSEDEI